MVRRSQCYSYRILNHLLIQLTGPGWSKRLHPLSIGWWFTWVWALFCLHYLLFYCCDRMLWPKRTYRQTYLFWLMVQRGKSPLWKGGVAASSRDTSLEIHISHRKLRERNARGNKAINPQSLPSTTYFFQQGRTSYRFQNLTKHRHQLGMKCLNIWPMEGLCLIQTTPLPILWTAPAMVCAYFPSQPRVQEFPELLVHQVLP